MIGSSRSRRDFAVFAGLLTAGLGVARTASAQSEAPATPDGLGISHDNAAIHQETAFDATPLRVYAVLTQARLFDEVVRLSGALQAMHLKATPATIGTGPGDAFALFGGYITGRHLELSPGERVVQAWRAASWPPHIYSIVRFELSPGPRGTRLVFDQTGFPLEEAVSLATGWRAHYWEPMAKALV